MPRQQDAVRHSWIIACTLGVVAGTLASAVAPTDTAFAEIARAFGISAVTQLWFAGLAIAFVTGMAVMHVRGDARIVELVGAISFVTYLMAAAPLIARALQDDLRALVAAPTLLAIVLMAISFVVAVLARDLTRTS